MIAQIEELIVTAISTFLAASAQEKFAIMGGVFAAASLVWNGLLIIRRKVVPTPASWAVWAALDIALALSMYFANALNPQMAILGVGAAIVFLLTLPFGKRGWDPVDKYCLIGGLGTVGLWFLTGNPTVATALFLLAMGVGCLPTYKSIKKDQAREDKTFWCLAFIASWCALIGTQQMSFDALAQPVGFILLQAYALWLLYKPGPKAQKA